MSDESNSASNNAKIVGIDAIAKEIGRTVPTAMRFIRDFKLPAERGKGGSVWEMDPAAFEAWRKAWGYGPGVTESDLELVALQKFYTSAGPGKTVSGDIERLARRLFTSAATLLSYARREGCPIKKTTGNQYEVDLNAWELWRLKNGLPPYAPKGRREAWT